MLCTNCGFVNDADAVFCENCGVSVIKKEPVSSETDVSLNKKDDKTNYFTQSDHAIKWIYEFSLWKNPVIFVTVLKVMLIACCVPALLMFFLTLADTGFVEATQVFLTVIGIGGGVIICLSALAYVIIALLYGGKYIVLFKMDQKGIYHIQLKKQFGKAQALGFLTALAGLAGGNLTAAGAGLIAATKQSQYSTFSKIKSIKIKEKRNTIYLNEFPVHNQIYVSAENFSDIKEYIISHCPKNVKITY